MRLTILFLLITLTAHTQGYTPSVHALLADSLGRAGDPLQAIEEWKQDFALQPDPETAYTLAMLYYIGEKHDSAFLWLQTALEKDSSEHALTEGDFLFLTQFPTWNNIENQQIKKIESKSGRLKNRVLQQKLWRIKMKDQAYTTQYSMAIKKLGAGHPVTLAMVVLNEKLRAENYADAERILSQYGWPKISQVGKSAAESIFYVIQHDEATGRQKYLPMLKAACKEKEAPWLWYATMYDRMLNDQEKKQCYGTQFSWGAGGVTLRKPIDAPEYVNKRRRELGLEPLTDLDVPQKD